MAIVIAGCASHDGVRAPPHEDAPASSSAHSAEPERDAAERSDTELTRARALLLDARGSLGRNDGPAARTRVGEAIALLLADTASTMTASRLQLLAELGTFAQEAGDLQAAERARRNVLEVRTRTLPDDHPDLQDARRDLAFTIDALGDFEGARALQEKVLEIRTRTLPPEHLDVARARMDLAATLYGAGDLEGALPLLERALEDLTRTVPEDHPELQRARQKLASALFLIGELDRARELCQLALDSRTRTLPDDHPDLQRVRQTLGAIIGTLGDREGARELQVKVLEVRLRSLPEEHPDVLAAQQNLASTLQELGDLKGARELKERVLAVRLHTLPEDHPDVQSARGNLANLMLVMQDPQGARRLLERVYAVYATTLPDGHPHFLRARQSLGICRGLVGDLQGSRELFEAVLASQSRALADDHPDLQDARINLATVLRQLDEFASARALYEKVIEVYTRTRPDDDLDVQFVLQNLGLTLSDLGDYEGARALEQKVLDVRSRTLPADHPEVAQSQEYLGRTLFELSELDEARALFERALESYSLRLPPRHEDLAFSQSYLTKVLARMAAEETTDERRRELQAKFVEVASDYVATIFIRARQAVLTAGPREAEERCAILAISVNAALSSSAGYGVFPRDAALERAVFAACEWTRAAAVTSAARASLVRSDARYEPLRAELQQASEDLARLAQGGTDQEEFAAARARQEELERAVIELVGEHARNKSVFSADGALDFSGVLGADDALVAYRRHVQSEFETASPHREILTQRVCAFVVRAGGRLERVDLGPLADVERAVVGWRRATGVETDEGKVAAASVSETRMDRGVGALPAGVVESSDAGDELRRIVFDPLRGALIGVRRVILCPDDVLHLVPLDALPDEKNEAGGPRVLLGDRLQIEMRATLLELLLERPEPVRDGALVLFGAPAYDRAPLGDSALLADSAPLGDSALLADASGMADLDANEAPRIASLLRGTAWEHGFDDLPATRAEVLGIGEHCERVFGDEIERRVLERDTASRESLFAWAPRATFLHLATHGWFAPESVRSWSDPEPIDAKLRFGERQSGAERVRGMNPMLLCGLALAGANLPSDDSGRNPGLITAEELATLDLSRCELAVLSACDTSVGERRKSHGGQGVASLQRALQMAGARSVITSLWKVPDEATKELMLDFYRRLWVEKKPKHQALWEAKTKLREAQDERGMPKYSTRDWAAWVLTGDPN